MFFLCKRFCQLALAVVVLCLPSAHAADLSLLPPVDSFASTAPAQTDAQAAFEALAALQAGERASAKSRLVVLEVDLDNSPGFSSGMVDGRLEARYRMAFNNVAEGWNWYPQADPQHEDYYRAKFFPLKSVTVERGEYDHQDKIGETQRMKVTWRYDYFLSFENLYDFYQRGIDDDAGFVASLPAAGQGEQGETKVRMLALASLDEPYVSESTTFWKATYGKPTDFTLKKCYLIGRLEAVWFVNAGSRRVLARLQRKTAP